jgi:hypothetical protein
LVGKLSFSFASNKENYGEKSGQVVAEKEIRLLLFVAPDALLFG